MENEMETEVEGLGLLLSSQTRENQQGKSMQNRRILGLYEPQSKLL